MEGSKSFSLNATDWRKAGIGLLVALAGALATYLEGFIPGVEFGSLAGIAFAVNSMAVNLLRKWAADNSK